MSQQTSPDWVTLTIDGVELQAPPHAMLIEVADQAGIDIPRFCYHKHLSVAANCRMCMVEVEQAPKPLPACATPVSDGMTVFTQSALALEAQKGTMEFLLINHPLDCPVCDQGGECELQDMALGYGADIGRYTERKRVVTDKNIGPLVSTDMTRCIHCTRCIRFGNEIAGISELGATGRGEFMRIGTFVEKSLSSELSGNIIDLCPVGALNAKPSRMKARAWEMIEHKHISCHDALGSNLSLHTLRNQVVRVVPRENPQINETWISDRDRFSYEGLYSPRRLTQPRRKNAQGWQTLSWRQALSQLAAVLKNYAPEDIGILLSPNQSNEELYLAQKVARGLNIKNIDHRVNQIDFRTQHDDPDAPWLGQNIADLESRDLILVIGSDLRSEQPMLTHRLRKAARRGAKVVVINPQHCDLHLHLSHHCVVKPQHWLKKLVSLLAAIHQASPQQAPAVLQSLLDHVPADQEAAAIARLMLAQSDNATVLIGSLMQQHYEYSELRAIACTIAQWTGATLGYIPLASNAVGAALLGALPHRQVMAESSQTLGPSFGQVTGQMTGMNWRQMIESPRKVYVLMGLEPEWDCALPAAALQALAAADHVIALNAFYTDNLQGYCDYLLPIHCYAESEGSKINLEGRWQSFSQSVSAAEEIKEGWKLWRMLGVELGLAGFDYLSIHDVREEMKSNITPRFEFSNRLASLPEISLQDWPDEVIFRVGAVPIYAHDGLVRQAASLQAAQGVSESEILMHSDDVKRLGFMAGAWVKVTQADASGIFKCVIDNTVLAGTVYIARGLPRSEQLGAVYGPVELERAVVAQA